MNFGSIRRRQHVVMVCIILVLSILAVNIYFYLIVGSSEQKLMRIISLKKSFTEILLKERAATSDSVEYEILINRYTQLLHKFADLLSDDEDALLSDRMALSDKLFLAASDTLQLRKVAMHSFYELINSIRYIHEHHIVYLRNQMRHGRTDPNDYEDGQFHKKDDRSASEIDIVKIASAMQTGLFDIVEIFDKAEKKQNLAKVKEAFARRMDALNFLINQFESYSLDAQDGILVEELLRTSRQMVTSFSTLLAIEQDKTLFLSQLDQNKDRLDSLLEQKNDEIKRADAMLKKTIRLLQFISLGFVLLMASAIIIFGRKTIEETLKTVKEARRIQDDIFYKIRVDDDTSVEFRIIFDALNTMTHKINSYVQQLQESEKKYRLLVENQTDMIVKCDGQGRFLFVSPSLCQAFGEDRQQMLKKRFYDLFPGSSQEKIAAAFKQAVSEPPHHNYMEGIALTKKGKKWQAWMNTAVFGDDGRLDSVIGVGRDVHDQKVAEEAIRKLSRAVDASPISVVITDRNGAIEYVNPKFCEITGYTRDEAMGRNPRILNSGTQPKEVFQNLWETISSGQEWHGIFCNKKKNGELYWESAALAPVSDEQGLITHYVAVKEDITERRRYEENLKAARQQAESAAHAKSLFLANMSHEIRTPLNAVIGFLDLAMEETALPVKPLDYLKIAQRSAKSLLEVINDILDISKLESGKLSIENRPFDLATLIHEIWETMTMITQERRVDLLLDLHPSVSGWFIGDALRLRQIMINLINNALKFTEKGHVLMQVRPEEGQTFHFMIEDTGIGIPKDRQTSIFEPFTQAENSMARRFGGTGLGTAICRELVELMGGRIWVESEVDKGSRFHFTIPLSAADRRSPSFESFPAAAPAKIRHPRHGFKILLVEDVLLNVNLVKVRLKKQQHQITAARNGKDAVDAFKQAKPDIILMDIQMPEMDGLEATRRIRAMEDPERERVPIIAMTAAVTSEETKEYMAVGMDTVVAKPIDFEFLIATMEELIPGNIGTPSAPDEDEETGGQAWAALPSMAGIDTQRAKKTWKNAPAYSTALIQFFHRHTGAAADLRRLIDTQNFQAARQMSHALKGTAGNLSVFRVAEAAAAVETHCRQSLRAEGLKSLEELSAAMEEAAEAIDFLEKRQKDAGNGRQPENVTPEAVLPLFQELLAGIALFDPYAVRPVLGKLSSHLPAGSLDGVQDRIRAFDFDGAKQKAQLLAGQLGLDLEDPEG